MKYFVISIMLSVLVISAMPFQQASQAMCVGADEVFHFWISDIAFIGTVSEITPSNNTDNYNYVTFDIKYSLKGLEDVSNFTVSTYRHGSYSYDFKVDSEYLVHANERAGVEYFTDLCSANQLLSTEDDAEKMMKELSDVKSIPPLKLKQYGIASHAIKCKDNLFLIQKYNDSPACVTESTKQKLVERGWTVNEN
ncbi:MAG: hypothetical protein K5798_10315 [Nitrosopumilus sp.]|uniref:hypothetical protein n=1 Tax=Nitrosopumilus sp. TaxID=2024843 RepID=UPI00242BDBF2|nr:hypothetical protein [Nitrosopumilus sp.]MCV0367638.1 hypothetical protein [Nitrosopumilus sp.]